MIRLDHIGVETDDIEASTAFWCTLLGTGVTDRGASQVRTRQAHDDNDGPTYVAVPHADTAVEIAHSQTQASRAGWHDTDIGAIHVAIHVQDADATLDRMGREKRSTAIPYGPCRGGRSAYVPDPGGTSVQLMQLIRRPGEMPILAADGWVDHIGIVVEEMNRSVAFYGRLLGSDPIAENVWRGTNAEYVGRMMGQPGLELEAVHFRLPRSNAQLELVQYSGIRQGSRNGTDSDAGGRGHFAFRTNDVSGFVGMDAADIPESSDGRNHCAFRAWTTDPDGVRLYVGGLSEDGPK